MSDGREAPDDLGRLKAFLGEAVVHVGRYEIAREIARGGTAIVYEARDPYTGRPVALKVFKEGTLEQARQEAAAAARLRYPGIVALREIGPDFVVMDYVEGRTLAEAMPELALAERMRVLDAVARAVEYAHEHGVIHRDLKPANVLIETDGHVLLSDFGLATIAGVGSAAIAGAVVGTPHYMAPEQIRGETPGPGTDLWALGVLLHEMVAGRRPFEGETPEEIYRQIADRDPEPLPAPFGAIGARALAKDPERRYPSVAAFRRDLERVWREPRARSPRTRGAWALALGGAAALAAAVTLAVVGRRPLEPSQEQAETLPIGLALEKSERDIQEHTRALLANPRDLGHLVGRAAALVARGGVKRGRGQNPLGDYADAERDLARALEHAPGAAEALFERGKLRVFAGSFKWRFGLDPVADLLGAEADLDRVLDRPGAQAWRGYARYFRAVHAADQGSDPRPLLEAAERDMTPARDAETLLRRARVRARLGKLGDAEQDFAEGLRLRPDHYVGWTWRGRAHLEAGDLAAAEGFLAHALAVEPRHAEAWETRASVRHARGNFTGAAADFKEAIRLNPSLEPLLREKLVDAETRSGPGQPR